MILAAFRCLELPKSKHRRNHHPGVMQPFVEGLTTQPQISISGDQRLVLSIDQHFLHDFCNKSNISPQDISPGHNTIAAEYIIAI